MKYRSSKTRVCVALTLVEMVIAMAIMVIVFAALLPQFRAILNSWDSKAAAAETLQNARVLIDHFNRNLTEAARITAVSDFTETMGYIEFEDNDGESLRYDVDANNYVQFGLIGSLSELAGPVSQFQFTCYDGNDFVNPTTDVNDIRFVKAEATLTNPVALGQDMTFTAKTYIRTNTSPCTQGLVGWWKLDETSGLTAADSSGNGNDGTLNNMAGDEWTAGPVDGALEFDGGNDYVDCGNDASLNITGAVTVTAWIKLTAAGIDQKVAGNQDGSAGGYKMTVYSNNKVEFEIRDSGNNAILNRDEPGGIVLTTGVWYQVASVYSEGNYIRTYVDGNLDRPMSTASVLGSTSGTLKFGREPFSSSYFFNGLIDDVRIYDRALEPEQIMDLADVLVYEEFTEAKATSDVTSITISTPGGGEAAAILGSWTSGLTHTAESGSNRLLIFTAHVEDNDADMRLNSVTYGGQSMTKVIERETQESSNRAYVVAYILDEAGIAAASGNTFSPSWSSTPDQVGYSSIFLSNVDQTTSIGASASNGSNSSSTISTSALSTSSGDMVIVAGTAGNIGTYSVNNGFTEAIELSITSSDGIAGYKSADGSNETPSITHSNPYRQVIIGFVVQANRDSPITTIEGDLLIAALATDGDTKSSLAPPGGEGWTEIDIDDRSGKVTLGAWWKLADASESPSHQFTWSGPEQAYGWMMRFTGHDATDPINVWASDREFSSTPTSPAVTTTVDGCLILRLGGFDNNDITVDAPGLSGHTAITMDASSGGGGSPDWGFVGWWKLDESSGLTATDSSGNGNDGTLTNMSGNEWTTGQVGGALAFDGSDDVIECGNPSSLQLTGTEVSVTCWFNADSLTFNDWPSLCGKSSNGEWDDGWGAFFYNGAAMFYVNRYQDNFAYKAFTATGSWHHFAGTYDGSKVKIYIDGVKGTDDNYSGSINDAGDFTIGEIGNWASGRWQGKIDDVRLYNRALSEDEITALAEGSGGGDPVSGGAGYVKQSAAGDSGTSDFSLTASEESVTLTIGIAPNAASSGGCGDAIGP